MTTELAHGFDPILMRYLPQLLCFEVKPNSVYPKMDYISLLVKASILNGYAEGTSNVSRRLLGARKGSRKIPTGETALSYFRGVDRYELQSAISIVLEEQVGELKRRGLLKRPVPIALDWHDQLFYGEPPGLPSYPAWLSPRATAATPGRRHHTNGLTSS